MKTFVSGRCCRLVKYSSRQRRLLSARFYDISAYRISLYSLRLTAGPRPGDIHHTCIARCQFNCHLTKYAVTRCRSRLSRRWHKLHRRLSTCNSQNDEKAVECGSVKDRASVYGRQAMPCSQPCSCFRLEWRFSSVHGIHEFHWDIEVIYLSAVSKLNVITSSYVRCGVPYTSFIDRVPDVSN